MSNEEHLLENALIDSLSAENSDITYYKDIVFLGA